MLSLNPWDILWTIVNLLVLYAIFRKFLFQPVMNIIHEREDMINKQFEDAQKQQAMAVTELFPFTVKNMWLRAVRTAATAAEAETLSFRWTTIFRPL